MLVVTQSIRIHADEFQWSYVRAGGPGGQNVNKVSSKAVLRWSVGKSRGLPDDVRARFRAQNHKRISAEGDFILTSQRYRDQDRNRQDCLEKLRGIVAQAAVRPKPRKPTKPTRGSREARLQVKRFRSRTKASRRRPAEE